MNLVTLIIPTYNRPLLLKRVLDYYSKQKFDINIIIADSSKDLYKKQNQKIIQNFPNLKISYLDKFPSDLVSHQKFGKMVEFVKTKYVCFCADDDFIIPTGIKEAVDFLEKNPDYSSAHGTYIYFYIFNNPLQGKKFWWNFRYAYESITSSDSVTRLTTHLSNYYQVLWAVRRTDLVKKAYREFLKSKVNPWFFGELLPDMLTLIYGKMKRLKNLYSAREAFSTSYSHWPSLMDAKNKGLYDKEYTKFKRTLINNLRRDSNLSEKELGALIDQNIKKYLSYSMQEHLTGRINLLLKNIPLLFKSVRLLHAKYLFSKSKRDRIGLIDNPSSKYFKEFEAIRQIVLQYENGN